MRTKSFLMSLPMVLATPSKRVQPAPLLKPRDTQLVEGKYIVKFKYDAIVDAVKAAVSELSSDADYIYNTEKFRGFASELTPTELDSVRNDYSVEYVEQDGIVTIKTMQTDADWGLARLSSKTPGSTTYTYENSAGQGTCAYIIDTGIDISHPEFESRAEFAANFADNENVDGQGHGTHVAGTIGSVTYGVAKKTKLFAVKVLDSSGTGTNSQVIAGMGFVVGHVPGQDCPSGVVVNMSLGGATSVAVNEAAAAMVEDGIFVAVAAGNEATDASTSSPASEKSVCTVGATDIEDRLAEYSNFGKLVDILAPGTDIKSTWPGNKTNIISGTSMASPHIAGLAAYLLGLGSIPADPQGLCSYIGMTGLSDVISGVPNSTVNILANNGDAESNGPITRRHGRRS